MTTTKTYPRARVSRHKVLDGWTVDLFLRAGAKPIKVNATYATIAFAHKSALTKLGIKVPASASNTKETVTQVEPPKVHASAGNCIPCGRPMRHPKTRATEAPGTVLRQREGICQSCNQRKAK